MPYSSSTHKPDPEPPTKKIAFKSSPEAQVKPGKIIDRKTAEKYASWVVDDRGFSKLDFLQKTMQVHNPGHAILVEDLHKKNSFYYIVPMHAANRNIHALMSIDALAMKYKEASFATDTRKPVQFRALTHLEIYHFLKRRLRDKKIKKFLPAFPELLFVYPAMVWTPCLESFSPFFPFYMIQLGDHKVYVRIDGKVYPKLTTNISGA